MQKLVLYLVLSLFFHKVTANENLIAFVGEKISVDEFEPKVEPDEILMDAAFKAKYRVIQVIYGSYSEQTIEFEAYDHYGRPGFEPYKHVLLFVSKYGNTFFHHKYQFFPVFKTLSGVWAGCGSPYSDEPVEHSKNIKPRKLDFDSDAYFDVTAMTKSEVRRHFPSEYFRVKAGRAYCMKGNSALELFEVEKNGVLKAHGLFKDNVE